MDKRKAFKFVLDKLNDWTKAQKKKNGWTSVEIHAHLGEDFGGEIIIKVPRPHSAYQDVMLKQFLNDDETMRFQFDTVDELLELLEKPFTS